MKVLLVYPNFIVESFWSPLGIAYLGGCLREKGHEVKCLDTSFMKQEEIDEAIRNIDAQVVGFSFMTTMAWDALRIAKQIKELHPNCTMVFGGPHPSLFPDECLKEEYVDIVCISEGEITFTELIDCLEKKGDLHTIDGIRFKENGKIVVNKPRPPIQDLDALPFPAFDLLDRRYFTQHNATASLMTERGCPFQCNYCQPMQTLLFGKKLRRESPARVVQQIRYLKDHFNTKFLMFADDIMTIQEKRVVDICTAIIEAKLTHIEYRCNTRVDTLPSDPVLQLMRKTGFSTISIGAESGSQVILDELKKKTTVQENVDAVKRMKKAGFQVYMYLMVGSPSETEETLEATVNLVKVTRPHFARVSITSPLPGTDLERICRERGIIKEELKRRGVHYYESFEHFPIKLNVSEQTVLKTKRTIESISRKHRIVDNLRKNPFYAFHLAKRAYEKVLKPLPGTWRGI